MDSGTNVGSSWGATFDLNESTGIGYDSILGMLIYFDAPAGVTLRMGWDGGDDQTSVGLGFTWWTGGSGLNTSISTAYDMVSDINGAAPSAGELSVTVGFGF